MFRSGSAAKANTGERNEGTCMTLHQMEIVATLLKSNFNISTTARRLNRVQSSISHQLHLLENEVGGRLFRRHGKRLTGTTPLCQNLLPEIRKAVQAKRNIALLVDEHAGKESGFLKIATTHTQARYFLPKAVEAFKRRYPQVQLIFHLDSPVKFSRLLQQHEIDLAVSVESAAMFSELAEKKCYSWNRSLVVCRGHPLATQSLSLVVIAEYPIITYMHGFSDRDIIEETFQQAQTNIDVAFSAGDTDVIKTYVKLDLGVGIVAEMAQSPTDDENLVFRSLGHLFKGSTTRVVYLKEQPQRQYMRDFIKILHILGQEFEAQLKRV